MPSYYQIINEQNIIINENFTLHKGSVKTCIGYSFFLSGVCKYLEYSGLQAKLNLHR